MRLSCQYETRCIIRPGPHPTRRRVRVAPQRRRFGGQWCRARADQSNCFRRAVRVMYRVPSTKELTRGARHGRSAQLRRPRPRPPGTKPSTHSSPSSTPAVSRSARCSATPGCSATASKRLVSPPTGSLARRCSTGLTASSRPANHLLRSRWALASRAFPASSAS